MAVSTGAPKPVRVIESLRYVGRSRQYSAYGTTFAHRAMAPRVGAAGSRRFEDLIEP
jgi:hypothetical protein